MQIEGDPAYSIYSISIRFLQNLPKEPKYPPAEWQVKDAPVGRQWNNVSWFGWASREEPSESECVQEAKRLWGHYITLDEIKDVHPSDPVITVSPVEWETWWLTWFQHATFDIGLSDAEVLASFGRYVDRKLRQNREEGKMVDGRWEEPHCLMGAEDRWQWRSAAPDDDPCKHIPPPCRCDGCKKTGLVRIVH